MTSNERLELLATMQVEFDDPRTTDERRRELLLTVREFAEEETTYRCRFCKHAPVDKPWHMPLIEGHVYSDAGISDFFNHGWCEYCFDKSALPSDDERRKEWFGHEENVY